MQGFVFIFLSTPASLGTLMFMSFFSAEAHAIHDALSEGNRSTIINDRNVSNIQV